MYEEDKALLLGFVGGVFLSIAVALMVAYAPGPTVDEWCVRLLEGEVIIGAAAPMQYRP